MKHKLSAAVTASVMMLSLMTGCNDKSGDTSNDAVTDTSSSAAAVSDTDTGAKASDSAVINEDQMLEAFKDTPDLEGDGPIISLSNTTAKPGELAEVTLSVHNADLQWNMCGIHIIYPEVLKPEMSNPEEREVEFSRGPALDGSTGFVCMEWQEGLPPILTEKKQGCSFFTCMFSGNEGGEGDIMTMYLKVPENAQPGAVYDLGYFYMNTDLFINEQNIPQFQKYAFTHMQGGTITVE